MSCPLLRDFASAVHNCLRSAIPRVKQPPQANGTWQGPFTRGANRVRHGETCLVAMTKICRRVSEKELNKKKGGSCDPPSVVNAGSCVGSTQGRGGCVEGDRVGGLRLPLQPRLIG